MGQSGSAGGAEGVGALGSTGGWGPAQQTKDGVSTLWDIIC